MTKSISLDPKPPIIVPHSPDHKNDLNVSIPVKKERKPRKKNPVVPKKDKPKQLKAKRTNYNTPYCFDETMLDSTGKFVLDAGHISWVDIQPDGYRINVQVGDNVYARYTTKETQFHFVYWMAYDLLLKSVQPDFETVMKLNTFVQQDYKKRANSELEV